MRIALVTESGLKNKNEAIYEVLKKVCDEQKIEVLNFGVKSSENRNMSYVASGILTSILLSGGVVDFVITGCKTGIGETIVTNMLPNVYCGYVSSTLDAYLFRAINGGNAVSIPFEKLSNIGFKVLLESIFKTLVLTPAKEGYPKERKSIQNEHIKEIEQLKSIATNDIVSIVDKMDKDLLKEAVCSSCFEEEFFKYSTNSDLSSLLKDFIDNINS